jgi:hypothetical protein
MKTIVFIFVPVYREQQSTDAEFQADMHIAVRKTRRIFFGQHRQTREPEAPFWTWFVDNPRPPSAQPGLKPHQLQ